MSEQKIAAGEIPRDIQRDVVAAATEAACDAIRGAAKSDPVKAARQVAEAAVAAWQVVSGVSP